MNILDQVRVYKGFLTGSAHTLFRDLMVCKISGVSFDGRQEVIQKIDSETLLRVVRDRRNEHDFYAVKVEAFVDASWRDAGFIPASINKEIAPALDAGVPLTVKLWRKTGGENEYFHGFSVTIKRE
jgi:hypothetical protein